MDGVYYWWTGYAILTFDMGMEVFRVIPAPFILPSEIYCCYCDLTLYDNDRIALYQFKDVLESGIDKWCDVWVMGVEGSWIKQFTVGPLPGIVAPMGFWKNGELLFLTNTPQNYGYHFEQLVMYNSSTQQNRHLGPKGNRATFEALVYHESLVSVKGGMYQRKGKLSDSVATRHDVSFGVGICVARNDARSGQNLFEVEQILAMLRTKQAPTGGNSGRTNGTGMANAVSNSSMRKIILKGVELEDPQ
ncbi:hypothetical protein RHGRI_024572 [Rhododendron griersonianum]|uniref:F-box associated domain-containing protein n=1 Tax=Rhododendron griersonianum TaxID=479676 RepID=A0AAV6J9Y7_9ERIC|nr:hypothetical protein RHGRI_024572 [Rhododendron griersonianum]